MPKNSLHAQAAIAIEDFMGLYANGDDTNVPELNHIECQNMKFEPGSIFTREGSVVSYNHGRDVRRFYFRHSEDLGNILLYLDVVGNLYGVRAGVRTLLHTNPQVTDFSITDTLNRVFITFHDGKTGIPGEFVYWWDGTNFSRAGGTAPTSSGAMVAATGGAGVVDVGTHILAISFENQYGFITKPGPFITGTYTPTTYVAPGGARIDLTNIPLGPPGTVARHILMSRANLTELFFALRIDDNTATGRQVNVSDTGLINSADYLSDLKESVPAGCNLFKYSGRLGVLGFPYPDSSLVLLSRNDGDFESFDQTTGFLLVGQDDRRKNKAAFEFRSHLYIGKTQGWFSTFDNGEEPVNWDNPQVVDSNVGVEVHGVCELPDTTVGNTREHVLIADRSGILVFNGVFQLIPLNEKVDGIWKEINGVNFYKTQILEDPVNRYIYVNICLDSDLPNYVLFGDYNLGMNPDKMRWSLWKFDQDLPVTISIMDLDGNGPIFRYGKTNNVYRLCPETLNDDGTPIDAFFKEWLMSFDQQSGSIFQYNTVQGHIKGSGTLKVTIEGLEKKAISIPPNLTMLSEPGKHMVMKFNFINERVAPKFRVNVLDEWFEVTSLYVNGVYYGAARPA